MSRIVQKFGGTSVANLDLIKKAAQIAIASAKEGHEVTIVVSAMGDTTDELIELAKQVSPSPSAREMDILLTTGELQSVALMSMAIQELGWPARAFTGGQAGIFTESRHGGAKIKEINPKAIEASLNRGEIAVVAGFQGITLTAELTTLGRGGSDTTAVALANALEAEHCDIYTDVRGVYTADPHILKEAKCLPCVSYDEMLELAATGAKVMNYRSVELAMETDLPVRIRSTFLPEDRGTLITNRLATPEYDICGITLDTNQVSMSMKFSPNEEGKQPLDSVSSLFTRLAELHISTDMVMLLAREDEPWQELAFTVDKTDADRVQGIVSAIWSKADQILLTRDDTLARLSVIGRTFTTRPELVAGVFDALHQASIPVQMVTSSDLRMSILLPKRHAHQAVKLIHERFGMDKDLKVA